jgi:hypothetical protein
MAYTVTGRAPDVPGVLAQGAHDVQEALRKACQMLQSGAVNVTIQDGSGNRISGDDLVACCEGRKSLTANLKTN